MKAILRSRFLALAIVALAVPANAGPLEDGLAAYVREDYWLNTLISTATHANTLRIAPPLVITPDEVDWAMEQFSAVLTQTRH